MYQSFFNFTQAPFTIAPDPHFIYMSPRHQEGLAHLLYGINQGGGFVALTGEVGTGKTTLCHCMLQQLPAKVDLAWVLNPKLSAVDLLATICDELSLNYDKKQPSLKLLVDCLNQFLLANHAQGRRTVLMIDEAQNLSFDVLEQIRLLTNLETSQQKLLQVILIGQPELQQLLRTPRLRQLNQRITARYHLLALDAAETDHYIAHRLMISHGDTAIFNAAAVKRIFQLSGGIPRLINIICDRALLGAYVNDVKKVSATMVNQAAKEVDSALLNNLPNKRFHTLVTILLISLCTAIYYYWPALTTLKRPYTNTAPPPTPAALKVETQDQPEKEAPIETGVEKNAPDSDSPQRSEPLTDFLQRETPSLATAFNLLRQRWNLPLSTPEQCDTLTVVNCLTGQTHWRELIALQRPVIMELNHNQHHYHLLLTGLHQGRPVFLHNTREITFTLHEILNHWQGYFLLFWQSPQEQIKFIYPESISPVVPWIRKQLMQNNPSKPTDFALKNTFDKPLQEKVRLFQQDHFLQTDGIVGPFTFIHLQNLQASGFGPRLQVSD